MSTFFASHNLGQRSQGRNNNLTVIRLCAAMAVLVSHTFFLVLGSGTEPMQLWLGETPGSLAVCVFFVISGFLVTKSLMSKQSVVHFVAARVLRIFPGLVAEAVFAAVVLGAMLSPRPFASYFSDPRWLAYVVDTICMNGDAGPLPGIMLRNGSLWTLPAEIALYTMLLCAWAAVARTRFGSRPWARALLVSIASAVLFALAAEVFLHTAGGKLFLMFCSGAAYYFLRDRVTLSPVAGLAALALLVIAAFHRQAFGIASIVALPYVVMCAAYLVRGPILRLNSMGDYSYGLYIFAFPIQVAVAHSFPASGVVPVMAMSAAATLALAALSWHLIESPSLGAVPKLVGRFGKRVAPHRPEAGLATPEEATQGR